MESFFRYPSFKPVFSKIESAICWFSSLGLNHLASFTMEKSTVPESTYREILAVADENGGKLKNRCVFFCDEFGTRATRSQLKRLRAR